MNRNNIYTVNPLYNGSTTQTTEDGSVQSGGTTIIYQQGGGTGLTDAQKQKLDGIQEGAEVNQNAYSKVRLNGSDALIIEAKNKTDILNMSGVYPIAIAINGNGGLDFTVSSDQSNTNSVVTQSQLKAAIDQLEKDKYWKVDADGKLYTELDVYSHKEISAYGAGTGGGSTGGAGALYECADVLRDGDKVKGAEVGSVLSYNGTHWYAIPQSAIVPDLSGYATKSYVSQEINDLIGGAPGTLDTLKEIAEALGNDPNFATTITNMINNIGLRVDDIETRVISLEDMFEWDKSASASDPSLWRIKAKKDLYGVGEISAYGLGETQPSVTTLAGLDDVTITSPANGQTLIYDSATSQWKNGTIIGGGNISLNGTVYKPVNGVITLPNLKPAEPTWFSLSNGNSGNVQVRTTGRTGYYEFWDTGAEWAFLAAKGYKTPGGTSSQFLKADGSVDGNLYVTQALTDSRYVLKTGDTMTGPLIIDVPVIPASPSISSPTKIGFKESHAQEVAFAYTDCDSYRAPAGIKLVSTENEPWFEAPWILGRKLNMLRVATEYSAGTGAVINYFGTDTIMDNQSSSVIGTLKIRLPVTWTNTMGVYKIMLYEYNGRGSSEITVSFYNYSSSQSYYNYSYQLNGAFEGAVRTAHDGSGCCILLGDTSYNWNCIKVYVYQVFAGQSVPIYYVDQNFYISIITSESGLTKITSIPKTSMNRHDTNYIRALNKNGYYGMAIVGNSDNVYIRAPRLGIIPYSSGNPGEGMLGTEGWQFSHVYANQIKTQRVSSVTHNLYVGSSGNSGWVYCQDICSANGTAEAYWSIRTNGTAVFTNLTSKNKITGDISGSAAYLPTAYISGTQANPQTYFNQNMGLRVAMTGIGWSGQWSDTLWINGYSGGDVLPMCALHFIRNGTPRFGISTQNSNGTSYGTNYEVWTAYNSNKDGVNWSAQTFFSSIGLKSRNICIETDNSGNDGGCSSEINNWNSRLYLQHKSGQHLQMCNGGGNVAIGGISPDYKLNVSGSIRASSWIRTDGATGWYSQSYGGGWHMTDSTWIRAYNNKQIYTASTSPDAIHTLGGINASGRIYSGSYVELHGGLVCAGVGNSGGASGFNVYGSFYGNASHGGIEIGASDNVLGIGVHSNDSWYIWWTNSGSIGSSSNKSYIFSYNGSSWNFTGSVVASGEVTAYSDARLKSNIHTLDYRGRLIPRHYVKDGKQSIGFIAQEVQSLYPELVLGYDKSRPYLSLNYNGCTAVLSAQLNHVEDEVTMLKNKVRELEIKVSILTEQLHSQAI